MGPLRRRRLNRACPSCSGSATPGRDRSSVSAARLAKAPRLWPRSISSYRMLLAPTSNRSAPKMSKTCTHMATIRDVTPSALGCEECLKTGDVWVHLRICRACGHVGCCDQSPNRHATKHYHATQHPIIEGYDPPEGWGWCYIDEVMFDLTDRMTPHNGRIPRYY